MDISGYALVTGGGSGIGRACAHCFAKEGAAGVALLDVNPEAIALVKAEIESLALADKFVCLTVTADIRQEEVVSDVIQQCAATFGRLDYVVNAAGIAFKHVGGAAFAETTDWRRVLDINLDGTFFVLRAATAIMLKQTRLKSKIDGRELDRGTVVNIASLAGTVGVSASTAYCSSKHAVVGLTKTVALDYAKDGLRINAVAPGVIKTPLIVPGSEIDRVTNEIVAKSTPMARMGLPEEVASVVVFLCGGRSSLMTGAILPVDGGYTAQ